MTGTELLMEVMEDFRDCGEATGILVVYTNEAGDAVVKSNCSNTAAIGLAEYAREVAMRKLMSTPGHGETT